MSAKTDIAIDNSHESEEDTPEIPPDTFVLPGNITFSFHPVAGRNVILSKNKQCARRRRPKISMGECVVYGAKPLSGTAEMEVEIDKYDDSEVNSSIRIGLMRVKFHTQLSLEDLPRYSEDGDEHCVWLDRRLYHNLNTNSETKRKVTQYGKVGLCQLQRGDRVGLHLTKSGTLLFLMNGQSQGVCVTDVYSKGFRVFPVVDIIGKCCGVKITRAGKP